MRAKYSSGEIIIGAGTVMDAATARIAILAGAEYIVSPYFDPETVKTCNRYGCLLYTSQNIGFIITG